jgi:hypothetical protein
MMTAAPLRCNKTLTAEQIMTFRAKKAAFRRFEIAQIAEKRDNRLNTNSLRLHAQNFIICGRR